MNGNDAAAKAIAALKASPMFQSLFNTGQEAVLQNASATGGVRGGNTQHALYDLGSNTLSQVIEDQLSRLGGLAGSAKEQPPKARGFGAHSADAISSALRQQGDALASKYLAKAGINAQNWKTPAAARPGRVHLPAHDPGHVGRHVFGARLASDAARGLRRPHQVGDEPGPRLQARIDEKAKVGLRPRSCAAQTMRRAPRSSAEVVEADPGAEFQRDLTARWHNPTRPHLVADHEISRVRRSSEAAVGT
jgi:hypothetical protein